MLIIRSKISRRIAICKDGSRTSYATAEARQDQEAKLGSSLLSDRFFPTGTFTSALGPLSQTFESLNTPIFTGTAKLRNGIIRFISLHQMFRTHFGFKQKI